MSEVNAHDLQIIKTQEDVLPLYQGAGTDSRAGIETELAFFNPENYKPMSVPQNKVLKNSAAAALPGDWVRNEPSSDFIEVNSIAGKPKEIRKVLDDINLKIQTVSEKAAGIGLKRSYFQDLPGVTAAQLLQTIMPVDRYQAFFVPPRADMQGFASYFTVCKSNQVSVSYRDPDHMLANVRRLYFLAPFLFMITDNGSGFREDKKFSGHAGMAYRSEGLLQGRGGVPPYVFTASSGHDYIRSHIEHVMNNPLFVHYDEKGGIIKLPADKWTNFLELSKKGLNTASNYFLAQSVLWPDVKIAPLKNEKGEIYNHRYEARMLGVGIHQHQTGFLIVAAIAHNPAFAEKLDALLATYGFHVGDPAASKDSLEKAYDAARHHRGNFLEIPYGIGSMSGFALEFAALIEEAYEGSGLDAELAPLLTICRSGYTDARISRVLFESLDGALIFQKEYNPRIFDDPNFCAYNIFSGQIPSSPANLSI
jgi:hypothetical protein